jgi:hypothetical protein
MALPPDTESGAGLKGFFQFIFADSETNIIGRGKDAHGLIDDRNSNTAFDAVDGVVWIVVNHENTKFCFRSINAES